MNMEDYLPLKEVAEKTGIPYTTLHTWVINDKIKGAIQPFGTRWYVHKKTVELLEKGEINVKNTPAGKGD